MMHFDEWWNSAAADSFRAKHEDQDGEVFRPVWDAALLCLAATPALPVTEDSSAVDPAEVRTSIQKISAIAACFGCDHPDDPTDTEVVRRVKWAARQLQTFAAANAEVQAEPVAKVLGWVRKNNGEISSHFHTYEPHCDRAVRDYGGEKIAVVEAPPQAQPADALDAEIAKLKKAYQELGNMFHDQIVAQQAAWIEWKHGGGAEAGMRWIENGLCGPGHIPAADEPYGTEAQAYFDANQADPLPTCHCGRPSNSLWMGKGFCSNAHYNEHRAAMAAAQEGGA